MIVTNNNLVVLLVLAAFSGVLSVEVAQRHSQLNYFVPNTCPDNRFVSASCADDIVPGCAGYRDGTYAYLTNGNRCSQCAGVSGRDIVSFNENERCPAWSTPRQPTPTPRQPEFIPNKCPDASVVSASCANNIAPGCAGYRDGTYAYLTNGNRCSQCAGISGDDIVSFNENERCPAWSTPRQPTPTPTPRPRQPNFIPNKCPDASVVSASCANNIAPGCAGYRDGTYAYLTNGNRCSQCAGISGDDIVSFNENERCPAWSTPRQPNFTPSRCPANNNRFCSFRSVPGCAGYRDGTYAYLTNGNKCSQCKRQNIVSFNENQRCPY